MERSRRKSRSRSDVPCFNTTTGKRGREVPLKAKEMVGSMKGILAIPDEKTGSKLKTFLKMIDILRSLFGARSNPGRVEPQRTSLPRRKLGFRSIKKRIWELLTSTFFSHVPCRVPLNLPSSPPSSRFLSFRT